MHTHNDVPTNTHRPRARPLGHPLLAWVAQALGVLALVAPPAHADTITRWYFNSPVPDGNPATGSLLPDGGPGTASALGGVSAGFASADANGGSSDPQVQDDSAWSLTSFAPQGTNQATRGAQFQVSTQGYEAIVVSFDIRHSQTSARHEVFQYSLDGQNFIDLFTWEAAAPDVWRRGRTVDLSALAGVGNNASFAFRVLQAFAPGTDQYMATADGSSYSTSGAWRFDAVQVFGAPVAAVPEPASAWSMALGLLVLGIWHKSRRR